MRHDSLKTVTAVATALGEADHLTPAISLLDALHRAGYAIVPHSEPLADPARDIIAGEIASSGSRPATEVANRIINRLAQSGIPGAGQPDGLLVPMQIAGVPFVALLTPGQSDALAAALAQGRAA